VERNPNKLTAEMLEKGPIITQNYFKVLVNLNLYTEVVSAFERQWGEVDATPLAKVHYYVARLPSQPILDSMALTAGRSETFWSDVVSDSDVDSISLERGGVSNTFNGATGEAEKAKSNWILADTEVRNWARNRAPLDLAKISKINTLVGDGLANNGKLPGVLRNFGMNSGFGNYINESQVESEMNHFVEWLNQELTNCDNGIQNPVQVAASAYQRLVSIHPFADANGRTTRLVMDYILQRYNLPPAIIKDANVAVFGGKIPKQNCSADLAYKKVVDGIKLTCQRALIKNPFKDDYEKSRR
jgi:hypothetical protein